MWFTNASCTKNISKWRESDQDKKNLSLKHDVDHYAGAVQEYFTIVVAKEILF